MDKNMGVARASRLFLLVLAFLATLYLPGDVHPAFAGVGKLSWAVVDTPMQDDATNVIASPSEISVLTTGADDRTFYASDIPNDTVYKSTNGGTDWQNDLTSSLDGAGARLPAWDIAVAPDNVNFVVAVTDGGGLAGPKEVFVSRDGGANWESSNLPVLDANEFISCVDISVADGQNREIAVATRSAGGTGKVFVRHLPDFNWADQTVAPSINWTSSNVVAIKFSPSYLKDFCLIVVSSDATGTYLHLGIRDIDKDSTAWDTVVHYPVLVKDGNFSRRSPTADEIITAQVQLPSDFSGQLATLRRYYVSTDIDRSLLSARQFGVHRIDDVSVRWIRPPPTMPTNGRISSISYIGNYESGQLLAGEVEGNSTAEGPNAMVNVWRTYDCTIATPYWVKSYELKSPTGGGVAASDGHYYANALVAWNSDGGRAYCGTSSASPSVGGTGIMAPPDTTRWPGAWTAGAQFDESALSISPYSTGYEQLRLAAQITLDSNVGDIWNQLAMMDTDVHKLSDLAIWEAPALQTGEETEHVDYSVLYLASLVDVGHFDSIWRSTSSPLGETWERILCTPHQGRDMILRSNARIPELGGPRSQVLVFADLDSNNVGYSPDEGQFWQLTKPGPAPPEPGAIKVTDLSVASDDIIYVLHGPLVRKGVRSDPNWNWQGDVDTYLVSGHTIDTPLKNPKNEYDLDEDWVVVGDAGPGEGGLAMVAYADFSELPPRFEPGVDSRVALPVPGNTHVVFDDRFDQNQTIYAASDNDGRIYRWVIGSSVAWDELQPPSSSFFGLAERSDVLYGLWNNKDPAEFPTESGADRTLYSTDVVPPALEWDSLTAGLPEAPADTVSFTREPSALKLSSNDHNDLWAIDNAPYEPNPPPIPPPGWQPTGLLWAYTDTLAKVGPWTLAPPSGDTIPVDPVSGRANEVNFRWRQLSYASVYELQLAKDPDFNIKVLISDNITPTDQLAPAVFFPSGGLVPLAGGYNVASPGNLEAGHTYYWRVRARAGITGDVVRSPWSATMYFTVKSGLPAKTQHLGPTLLKPPHSSRDISSSPGFSWSPVPATTRYEFTLAEDAALERVVVKAKVSTTAYTYDEKLNPGTAYYWQVRALEPVPSDPSEIGSFTVKSAKTATEAASRPARPPLLIFGVLGIYAVLVIAIIILIERRRAHNGDDADA